MTLDGLLAAITKAMPESLTTELIGAVIAPVFLFATAPEGSDTLTHIGGAPVMSADIAWPEASQSPYADINQRAERFTQQIGTHLNDELPLSFVAQVDLATLPRGATLPEGIPAQGRLMFFYDMIAGPFENGPRFAAVIWDTRDTPVERQIPPALKAAEERYIAETKEALANFEFPEIDAETRKLLLEAGMSEAEIDEMANMPAPDLSNEPVTAPYIAPRTPKVLLEGAQLPSAFLPEFASAAPAAHMLYFGSTDASYDFQEAFDTLIQDTSYSRFLGLPTPVQDDPRLDAAIGRLFSKQFIEDEWTTYKDAIMAEAQDWQLLLEITMSDWLQSGDFDGTVYFLIHEDDLKARRFDRAVAIYQQT